MINTIVQLGRELQEGKNPSSKELKAIYPDELIDILARKMDFRSVGRHLAFKETIIKTRQKSELGYACLLLLGALPRSMLFEDTKYSMFTPTIPLVYEIKYGDDFDTKLNTSTLKDAFASRSYSKWDNTHNFLGGSFSKKLALGIALANAYTYRQRSLTLVEDINNRRALRDYEFPTCSAVQYGTSVQMALVLQLGDARPSLRDGRMILNINDWDNLPKEMCE